mmetsp:Transcript_6360/g.11587  ORF Transcript_6360/g.11587 Transcript_6360/m.11587 type:complete len:151 (-) Transcript_6360:44-496(-)
MTYRLIICILTLLLIDVSALIAPNCKISSVASSRRRRLVLRHVWPDAAIDTAAANQQICMESISFVNRLRERNFLQFGISNFANLAARHDDVHISSSLLVSEETSSSSIAPEHAGKWFFLAYVVVSFAAGFKELGVRFQKWLANREKKSE